MSTKKITESGMAFVVDGDTTFEIEKAGCINGMSRVKTAEFVSLTGGSTVRIVEAKTSAPNP